MQFLDYLNSLSEQKIKPGLERIMDACSRLGDPQNSFRSVHIAGTNGKGSTAVFLEKILRDSGNKVGLYTSPHLVRINERIQIDRKMIFDGEIEEIFQYVHEKTAQIELSYFELLTLISFEYFKRMCVDFAVIEVGLGGRWDATNVIMPSVTLFTKISLDHSDILGSTIDLVAKEKAQVIKSGVSVISVAQDGAVMKILEREAAEKGSPFRSSSVKSDLKIGLSGAHQLQNASLALSAAKELANLGFKISDKPDLSKIYWPGRLQKISNDPEIIVDGAHNPDGMAALAQFLKDEYRDRKKIVIFSAMNNKDHKRMIDELDDVADAWVFYELGMERSLKAAGVGNIMAGRQCEIVSNVPEAIKKAQNFNMKNPLIVVTGSLYLVGEFLKASS